MHLAEKGKGAEKRREDMEKEGRNEWGETPRNNFLLTALGGAVALPHPHSP